ncbi:MAG: DUF885 domain-containing protein [Actinobacteria bacterium]|nr:DUF885 domain-containing protein [Actinomycetota bacterium]
MLVDDYLLLGLCLGRHIDGLVDAYYGPPELARRVEAEPVGDPASLRRDAAELIAALDAAVDDHELGADRRHWLRAQAVGLHTTARKLAGEKVSYADEVELCYGVRPKPVPEDELASAHAALDQALPGRGNLRDRYIVWREAQAVPVDKLHGAIHSLADDFRERTQRLFGLPDGEHVDFELTENQPWSGFNYYLGGLHSRVAINTDLPVLSHTLGHLVAHEAYPGHHTEHTRKEVGLVRQRHQQEETIFLVGTPQCLLAEGLADLGIEIVAGERPEPIIADHLQPLGIPYDPDLVASVSKAADAMNAVRGNVAWMLHEQHADPDDAIAYAMRWSLLPRNRAEKMLDFLTDETWCSYISCYVEGLPLCRRYVNGDPRRFERLLADQMVPADLAAAA